MPCAPAGITFEGKLSPDGNSIAGNFVQGPNTMPITLVARDEGDGIRDPGAAADDGCRRADGVRGRDHQAEQPECAGQAVHRQRGREVLTINTSLSDLITFAYNVHPRQIVGGPSWMASDKYDVTGRPLAEGSAERRQLREMIRTLLEDRFKLTIHRDKREMPAYAITVGKSGATSWRETRRIPNGLPGLLFKGLGMLPVVNATMGDFASVMQTRRARSACGRSHRAAGPLRLHAELDARRIAVPQHGRPGAPAARGREGPPGLFTAIQEQLGLRLESVTAPVEVLVIDRVETAVRRTDHERSTTDSRIAKFFFVALLAESSRIFVVKVGRS